MGTQTNEERVKEGLSQMFPFDLFTLQTASAHCFIPDVLRLELAMERMHRSNVYDKVYRICAQKLSH